MERELVTKWTSPNSNTVAAEAKLPGDTHGACDSWKMDGKVLSGSSPVRKRGHQAWAEEWNHRVMASEPQRILQRAAGERTRRVVQVAAKWLGLCMPWLSLRPRAMPSKGDFLACWVVSGQWVFPVKPLLSGYWLRPQNELPKPSFFSFTSQDNNSSAGRVAIRMRMLNRDQ